ncbi:putative ATP-dependent helicase Lhr [Corynebacterium occultum]|uniref:Putative ATP-dependent helicase Lhr n=1 Tax=Corynebacterium occultum TaxID=2675219 RepID=A0A6B8VRI1_9CORY|nr:DEAD/DEAH box helicase [Corynebacterium occultum]QGU06723.1 putative ATP-dependent helicase Lhr [Corynebacterium occultum]
MANNILERFRPQVATWFQEVFARPTAVQEQAWEKISAGDNALVVAPTGSGKTLAAFLWALNSLVEPSGQTVIPVAGAPAAPVKGKTVKVLYISPLKALGVDVENNLRAPLTGISRVAERLGLDMPTISVAVRSGDTPAAERNRQLRNPPDILITTPESAYLMLTSKAAATLRNVDTIIIDEIHALAGTKRGAHLALSLERLERLRRRAAAAADPDTPTHVQRIGLSATVRPLETVAGFLGGDRPVEIISPPIEKQWQLDVHVPVPDMSDLPTPEQGSTIGEFVVDDPLGLGGPSPAEEEARERAAAIEPREVSESALPTQKSIWPFIETELYREVMAANSTLIFVNSRRTAERLTSRLNELYAEEFAPETLSPPTRRDPAQLMAQSGVAGQAPAVIARAHHGSVSKDERAMTEQLLKEGALKAVVATSSLELGIDMGAVDLVLQVESPPSVASGLQRVGRAGHSVGQVSVGSFYPKHRSDLVQSAVTVDRMRQGMIEELKVPRNPLDVLLQQTVAAVAVEDIDVEEWYATVRRARPYRELPRDVFDAVIDLAAGVYPSTDFAELRPRIVFDRVSGMMSARPGAQRVAVTSGGTIPDRGMFGVFLAGGEGAPRRVGELDEEMVYESRVGDVFTLGASSWRIEDITRDQVIVTPAPGHTGRLPFWTGDAAGRPAELGQALGAFRREVHADPARLDDLGLDVFARDNLLRYLVEQAESTGLVPDEKTLVLERFRDELGDWRVVLHSPYGRGVNAAWALAVGALVAERTGMDAQAVAGDDGIVLRLPEGEEEPSAALFLVDADEIGDLVTAQVGNSALFASRFRECAARGLLLPRRNPGKRAPLWQQRQRAAQLLDVARKYPSFPIILETVRECLQDVYDLPALTQLCRDLGHRRVRIAEVTVEQPSPFAVSLLFNYTGAFMYEGDSPLAEKRAAALALDPSLLAKLLGEVELRELLDPEIIEEVHTQLQRTHEGRRARDPEELADVLRILGPVPVEELGLHCTFPGPREAALAQLGDRVMQVRINGREHLAQTLDAPLLRDALGVPVPPGVAAQVATVLDALDQLVGRFVRTRGPFTLRDLAESFGLGASAAHAALQVQIRQGSVVEGRYRQGVDEQEYCATEVLRIIRSRSLAAARKESQPVSQTSFARFLPEWQQLAPVGTRPALSGADGVFAVIEQLAGVRLPASAWETLVLPSRVGNYSPEQLDELTASGEVLILGAGSAGARDPWLMLLPADYAAQLAPEQPEVGLSALQESVLGVLGRGGGFHFPEILVEATGEDLGLIGGQVAPEELREAIWGLVEAGLVAPDSFAPIRARLAGGSTAHRAARRPTRSRLRMGRTSFAQATRAASISPPDMAGRWALAVPAAADATSRSVAHGEAWLDRYGVLTRGSVVAEDVLGGFALAYKVLSRFEENGKAMRGYLIEGLGAAQFSTPAVIDRLRGMADTPDLEGWPSGTDDPAIHLIAAADPANPYGAALPWPEKGPSRAAGASVILVDGLLLAHLTRGGRSLSLFLEHLPEGIPAGEEQLLGLVVHAISEASARNAMSRVVVEKINGTPALEHPLLESFRRAGAGLTPQGIRIGGRPVVAGPRRGRSMAQALEEIDDEPQVQ